MIQDSDDLDLDPKYKSDIRILSIGKITSEVLAAHIVAYRAVGAEKIFATVAMLELARRRQLGEDFDFETFIDAKLAEMPKIQPLDIVGLSKGMKTNIQSLKNIIK